MAVSSRTVVVASLCLLVVVAIVASAYAAPAAAGAADKEDAAQEKRSFLEQIGRRSQTLWSQFKWPMTQTYLQRHAKLLGIFLTAGVTAMYLVYSGQKLIACLRKRSSAAKAKSE